MDTQKILKILRTGGLKVKVRAGASKDEITGELSDGTIKINLRAKRERGKANLALIKFLTNYLEINSSSIKIVSGFTSSIKLLVIRD